MDLQCPTVVLRIEVQAPYVYGEPSYWASKLQHWSQGGSILGAFSTERASNVHCEWRWECRSDRCGGRWLAGERSPGPRRYRFVFLLFPTGCQLRMIGNNSDQEEYLVCFSRFRWTEKFLQKKVYRLRGEVMFGIDLDRFPSPESLSFLLSFFPTTHPHPSAVEVDASCSSSIFGCQNSIGLSELSSITRKPSPT